MIKGFGIPTAVADDMELLAKELRSGKKLIPALEAVIVATQNRTTIETFTEIQAYLDGGEEFWKACETAGGSWGEEVVTGIIHAGEVGGVLDEALERMASHIRKESELKTSRVRGIKREKLQLALWLRMLGLVLTSGVPILRALEIVASFSNEKLSTATLHIRSQLREGTEIWRAMRDHEDIFGAVLCLDMSRGEDCGNVDAVCERQAERLEQEVLG